MESKLSLSPSKVQKAREAIDFLSSLSGAGPSGSGTGQPPPPIKEVNSGRKSTGKSAPEREDRKSIASRAFWTFEGESDNFDSILLTQVSRLHIAQCAHCAMRTLRNAHIATVDWDRPPPPRPLHAN